MVAQKLKELRAEHKLTQNTVASVLNISRSAYSMYENGKRQLNYEALFKMADYYHVSMDYLFGRIDTPDMPLRFSREEQYLLQRFRGLDARGRANILNLVELESGRTEQNLTNEDEMN